MAKTYNPLYDESDKVKPNAVSNREKLESSLINHGNLVKATIAGGIPVLVNLDDRTVFPTFNN